MTAASVIISPRIRPGVGDRPGASERNTPPSIQCKRLKFQCGGSWSRLAPRNSAQKTPCPLLLSKPALNIYACYCETRRETHEARLCIADVTRGSACRDLHRGTKRGNLLSVCRNVCWIPRSRIARNRCHLLGHGRRGASAWHAASKAIFRPLRHPSLCSDGRRCQRFHRTAAIGKWRALYLQPPEGRTFATGNGTRNCNRSRAKRRPLLHSSE